MTDKFSEIIGQKKVKEQLNFFLEGFRQNGIVRPFIVISPKGMGKTILAKAFKNRLIPPGQTEPKKFIKMNSASITSETQFFDQVVNQYVSPGANITLFFDEASELPKSVQTLLLSILNNQDSSLNTYTFSNGQTVDFDLKHITWIFATNQPQKVLIDLMDRLEKVTLEDYTTEQLSYILDQSIKKELGAGFCVDDESVWSELLKDAVSTCRGNPRLAFKLGKNIAVRIRSLGEKTFGLNDWLTLKSNLNIHPMGLDENDIRILKAISEYPMGITLTALAGKVGMTTQTVRENGETFLMKIGLIRIDGKRVITQKGREYLEGLKHG